MFVKPQYNVETGFGPLADYRMGVLFTITEPGNNRAADALIAAAVTNGKIPAWAFRELPSNLAGYDQVIPPSLRRAIEAALKTHYLKLDTLRMQDPAPSDLFFTPRPGLG